MRPQVFSQTSQVNTGEEVDGKPGISGEQPLPCLGHAAVPGPLHQLGQPNELCQLLKQNLDKYPGAEGCVVFVQLDDREHTPANGICVELSHIPRLTRLQPVDGVVCVQGDLAERFLMT